MKQSKTAKYAYVAGIIDGEGCIRVHRNRTRRGYDLRGYDLAVTVTQNDGRILDFCLGVFGGKIYETPYNRTGDKDKILYKWVVGQSQAVFMLKRILPFLRRKKAEAQLGMEFENFRAKMKKKHWETFATKGRQGCRATLMPDWIVAKKEEYFLKMRDLKKEIFPTRAAAETKQNHSSETMESDSPILQETIA
ncbi:MAG: hypothetical protein U9R38_03105 [Candidatus Margulisiibacteriota bacterium]|nr:hypothetical protein [Candidatus Margulisiibacteriota bacterium]